MVHSKCNTNTKLPTSDHLPSLTAGMGSSNSDSATKRRITLQTQWKLGDAGILAGGGDSRLRFEAEQRQESRNGAQHGSDAGEEAGIGEGGVEQNQ
jgi:hypothetical protein